MNVLIDSIGYLNYNESTTTNYLEAIMQQENEKTINPIYQIHLFLGKTYPSLFSNDKSSFKPLAIGITKTIIARHVDDIEKLLMVDHEQAEKLIHNAIYKRCNRKSYYRAMIADGAMRYDLDGNPTELVTEEQRKNAQKRLNEKNHKENFRKL